MEFILTVVMCSGVANICLPPHTFDTKFPTAYECMVTGYAESGRKIKEIGPDEVNQHEIYIKFDCIKVVIPPKKPKVVT